MNFNPYQAPARISEAQAPAAVTSALVTERIVEALRQTRPWLLFVAICCDIGGALMLLVAVVTLITDFKPEVLVFVVLAAGYLVPAIGLHRCSTAIHKLLHGGALPELEQALEAQRGFWQLIGVMIIVVSVSMVALGIYSGS